MITLVLKGISQKGKNRINQLGAEWSVLLVKDTIQFSSEKGPWILIHAKSNIQAVRWIHYSNDKDFKIENSFAI